MKLKPLLLVIASCITVVSGLYAADASKKLRVGVLDFNAKNVTRMDASAASDIFRSEVVRSGKYDVIDRNNMDQILQEQAFQQTGCTETACAVKIGKMLNMEVMVYGTLMKVGTKMFLTVEMVSVESGKIMRSERETFTSIDKLEEAIRAVVGKLTGIEVVRAESKIERRDTTSIGTKGTGLLSIKSVGANDAKVFIDGKEKGRTPFLQEVAKGKHSVKIYTEGFLMRTFETVIEEGKTQEITVALARGVGAEEAKVRSDEAFEGVVRNGIITGGCLLAMTGCLIGGNAAIDGWSTKLADYQMDYVSSSSTVKGDELESMNATANVLFSLAETTLVLSAAFLVWGAYDFFNYMYFNDLSMRENRKKALIIIPSYNIFTRTAGLTVSLNF
ncbi:MAG: PEGA domain-containing protein [Spirochaetes bacterium]|nr:PEGA domain-containing protein [Spirochaetota bacterium]